MCDLPVRLTRAVWRPGRLRAWSLRHDYRTEGSDYHVGGRSAGRGTCSADAILPPKEVGNRASVSSLPMGRKNRWTANSPTAGAARRARVNDVLTMIAVLVVLVLLCLLTATEGPGSIEW